MAKPKKLSYRNFEITHLPKDDDSQYKYKYKAVSKDFPKMTLKSRSAEEIKMMIDCVIDRISIDEYYKLHNPYYYDT